ncbi:MAG: GTPase ObgE [Planctomycetaceae bacterium]|nr:GTPase ObgE [Planctomycetaceae bacterium]
MLIDHAIILVRGGNGGDGSVSFRREAYVPKGGPDGGDGGDGGSVILRAVPNVDTLLDLAGRHHWFAENGRPGWGSSRAGRAGEDLIVRVPPGTVVYDDTTGDLIGDLDAVDLELLAAPGGRGGLGNEHFKSSTHQAPRRATPGDPGIERRLRLELKLIADVGLVGLPNAGKSTLLSRISAARPKIADYPFTTLEPQLGIAALDVERRLVIADIPGLIEGAQYGAGLGHDFLRHIERTRIIVHLLDVEPPDKSDPADNYHTIRRELAGHSPELAAKPEIIALNKLDLLPQSDHATAIELIEEQLGQKVLPLSGATGINCDQLLDRAWHVAREL